VSAREELRTNKEAIIRQGGAAEVSSQTHAQQTAAADCLQRPLRSRFRQRLTPGVMWQARSLFSSALLILNINGIGVTMKLQQNLLDFYMQPTAMTSAGEYTALFKQLPNDVGTLVRIVQGLGIYDVVAPDFYGFTIPDERRNEIHIRPVAKMLDRLLAIDAQPLTVARPVEKRLVCRCRHFLLFLLSLLRAKGVPSRARCGFASYFHPGYFEDHWVCEYWNAAAARWVLVDAQLDEVWREKLKIDFDILDLPRDRFLVAGVAWEKCRAGEADPSQFGISFANLRDLWFVAGDLVRDVAALNKMEMLPWDMWGAQPKPDEQLNEKHLAFFDKLATLSHDPDASFNELRKLYTDDDRLRVPATVFNSLLNRAETL
jgi:hypothetical protein